MAEKEPRVDLRQRIDKWLFFARIAKSRSRAQMLVEAGLVSVNGAVCSQASRMIGVGDRLELLLESRDLVVIVRGIGERRGPFEEARHLYDDVSPAAAERLTPFERAQRMVGNVRPRSF